MSDFHPERVFSRASMSLRVFESTTFALSSLIFVLILAFFAGFADGAGVKSDVEQTMMKRTVCAGRRRAGWRGGWRGSVAYPAPAAMLISRSSAFSPGII